MTDILKKLIFQALASQEALLPSPIDKSKGDETPIFGENGQIDSMGLVSLIVQVEEAIEREFGISLILASERAMSTRRSPFSTVSTFAAYINELMTEQEHV
jgi:acyl carrier protein